MDDACVHDVKKPTLRSVDLVEIGRADVVCIKHPEDGGRRHISIPESRSAFGEPQERWELFLFLFIK